MDTEKDYKEEEFRKTLMDYYNAEKEYHEYMDGFFTHYSNGELAREAIRAWSSEEYEKVLKMEKELEEKWEKLKKAKESFLTTLS